MNGGIGVTRLRDGPAEWGRQYAMLGLSVYGGDLMAAPGADAHEEGVQRPRRLGRRPRRLDQHGARVTAADLADAPVMGRAHARLPNPWVYCGARAAKRVEDEIAALGTVFDGIGDQSHRLDRGVRGKQLVAIAAKAVDPSQTLARLRPCLPSSTLLT